MKNIIFNISGAGLALCISLGVQVSSATAASNKKCFSGSGVGTVAGTRFNAKHEAHLLAVSSWNTRARAKLHSTVPNWQKSTSKFRHVEKKGNYWRAKVGGRFCIYVAVPVKTYKPKCAANDIKCKARNFKAIQKNKIPSHGVR